jgi:hypothetical protein
MTVLHASCIWLHLADKFCHSNAHVMTGCTGTLGTANMRTTSRSQMDDIVGSTQVCSPIHIVCARGRVSSSNRRITVVKGDHIFFVNDVPNLLQAVLNLKITSSYIHYMLHCFIELARDTETSDMRSDDASDTRRGASQCVVWLQCDSELMKPNNDAD